MADYKAGDLNLSIQSISNDTIKLLDAVIERLSIIQKGLGGLKGFIKSGSSSVKGSSSGSRTEKTYQLNKFGREYVSLQKDIEKTEKTLRTITRQFDEQGKVIKKTSVELDEFGNKTTKITGGNKKSSKGGLFGFAKLGISLALVKKLGRGVADLVQAGSDYTETLNLWQVAMRGNIDTADEFVNKMQKAYGISSKTVMNAQATFKNMIGSLGQISDQTAYALSEALVQMSADYASLYNRSIESAFQNMQSMLAGQVRPIRSAGLDMTETTLFQYYQQIGGTKTMRQLNRTEKQLLSILAVYKQMGSAGALGDMSKTLNQFANQSRMMTEYWAELKTWSGLLLKDLIDQSEMLLYINALLITTTEVLKAIAKSRGLGEENFIDGMSESAEATNDEIDELKGKLLDFDKFRSLETTNQTDIGIDQKLLEAITGYSSKIDSARNAANEIAKGWLSVLGFTEDANGEFDITESNLEKIEQRIKNIGYAILGIIAIPITNGIIGIVAAITKWFAGTGKLISVMNILSLVLLGGAVYSILKLVEAFKNGDYWTGILYTAIGISLVTAFVLLRVAINKTKADGVGLIGFFSKLKASLTATNKTIYGTIATVGILAIGITLLIGGVSMFISNFDKLADSAKIWIPVIATLVGVLAALATGVYILKGNWLAAIGIGAAVTGVGLMVGTKLNIPNYEDGAGDIDSGTVFRAGEFGKTEAVYTGSNGKTNVANIQQMKAAELQALNEWWATAKNDIPAFQGVSNSGIYTIVDGEAKRRGKKFANA